MNLKLINEKLIVVARAHPPSDHVPYAFEKRIMAHLVGRPVPDTLAAWGQAFFRAAIACAALVLVIGTAASFLPEDAAPVPVASATATVTPELAQQFQDTLLAAVDSSDPVDLNEEVW